MKEEKKSKGNFSRRKFLGSTAALAALSMVPKGFVSAGTPLRSIAEGSVPDSSFGGVQIGTITYSWRSLPGGVENIIKYCTEAGISSIELMSGDVEDYLGAPTNPMMAMFGPPPTAKPAAGAAPAAPPPPPPPPPAPPVPGAAAAAPAPPRFQMTPEQKAAMEKYNQDAKKWRLAQPISKFEEVKKMFDKAGIKIHIVKFSPARWSDEEIDYAFKAAKALGAKGVTEELGKEAVEKLGPIAAKHGMYAIFHNHMQFATPGDEFRLGPLLWFNRSASKYNPREVPRQDLQYSH